MCILFSLLKSPRHGGMYLQQKLRSYEFTLQTYLVNRYKKNIMFLIHIYVFTMYYIPIYPHHRIVAEEMEIQIYNKMNTENSVNHDHMKEF
jgi:hypothetical protein